MGVFTGASIPPEAMMHFPPFSDFPLFSKKFQTLWKSFNILPFPETFLDFHPSKFLMTFFSHRPQISNSPYFPCFSTFPLFRENYYFPPLLSQIYPCLKKIHLLFTYFTCISFPLLWPWCIYASPNARTERSCAFKGFRIINPRNECRKCIRNTPQINVKPTNLTPKFFWLRPDIV